MPIRNYVGIGLMSGSSLDAVDLAAVEFEVEDGNFFNWTLMTSNAYEIPFDLKEKLIRTRDLSVSSFASLDNELGNFFGECCAEFIKSNKLNPDYIASHGHTIEHHPRKGYSIQIGSPNQISAITGITTLADFRSKDIAKGGEGAPLAPVVEHYLFSNFKLFLNLGGIANISIHKENGISAFDVCPANQLLNFISKDFDAAYDKDGAFAALGENNEALKAKFREDSYLQKLPPKSLDNHYLQDYYFKLVSASKVLKEDKMRTAVEFITEEIARCLKNEDSSLDLMVTGGGAFNSFLIKNLQSKIKQEIYLPSKELIEQKESILMSLCGLLRILEKPNSFASVTGASEDTVNGAIYL